MRTVSKEDREALEALEAAIWFIEFGRGGGFSMRGGPREDQLPGRLIMALPDKIRKKLEKLTSDNLNTQRIDFF